MEFVTEDWERFRTIEGLSTKAGVSPEKIAALVAKELMDNALDANLDANTDTLPWIDPIGTDGFLVGDNGPGIDPDAVADMFSINRPLKSTKHLRLPTRGALGNGLRVVAGAVLATGGSLIVTTRGLIMKLTPQHDNGKTLAEVIGYKDSNGTLIEVHLGGHDAGPINLRWAKLALQLSSGEQQRYSGKTSPWWYTSRYFYELCRSAKDTTIRELISKFEGCSSSDKVGYITNEFKIKQTTDLTLDDAKTLLTRMQIASKPVKPERLGCCDSENFSNYVKIPGTFELTSDNEVAEIPYIVEAWSELSDRANISFNVNKTPITGDVRVIHDKTRLYLIGCGANYDTINIGKRPAIIWMNIITPFMPITSDGKAPNLQYFLKDIMAAIEKSINKARKNAPKNHARSQKDIVIENIPPAAKTMGGGHQFSLRQLFYAIRPIVKTEINKELKYEHFTGIITEYEGETGEDIPDMYRDDRGALYHPHLDERIALGTRMAKSYKPPEWTFNKVLYIEKEGFFQILQDDKWPEKHDCALLTSKGYSSRAARDLLDLLGEGEQELLFFCVHDADASGTMIYQTLQDETKARPGRKFKIINLGLDPWEGIAMGLEPENSVNESDKYKAVGDYVSEHDPECVEWLQTHRIELNEMSTPQFLQWLDDKMEMYSQGKLTAPVDIMVKELHDKAYEILKQTLIEEILQENDLEGRLNCEYEKLKPVLDEKAKELTKDVRVALQKEPTQSWRDPVLKVAEDVVESSSP